MAWMMAGEAVFATADVTRAADQEARADLAAESFAALDLACNNAAAVNAYMIPGAS
jgi:hypothetical protein